MCALERHGFRTLFLPNDREARLVRRAALSLRYRERTTRHGRPRKKAAIRSQTCYCETRPARTGPPRQGDHTLARTLPYLAQRRSRPIDAAAPNSPANSRSAAVTGFSSGASSPLDIARHRCYVGMDQAPQPAPRSCDTPICRLDFLGLGRFANLPVLCFSRLEFGFGTVSSLAGHHGRGVHEYYMVVTIPRSIPH
jgi:hypothetical protein